MPFGLPHIQLIQDPRQIIPCKVRKQRNHPQKVHSRTSLLLLDLSQDLLVVFFVHDRKLALRRTYDPSCPGFVVYQSQFSEVLASTQGNRFLKDDILIDLLSHTKSAGDRF